MSAEELQVVNMRFSRFHEVFTSCLQMAWLRLFLFFVASTVAVAVAMCVLYAADPSGLAGHDPAAPDARYALFVFSLGSSISSPVPYSPSSPYCTLVCALHSLLSQLIVLFFTGVTFARISAPARSVRAARVAVIEGGRLSARMVVERDPPQLFDVRFSLMFKHTRLSDGFTRLEELPLVKDSMATLMYGFYVRTVIDEGHPMYGYTPERLEAEQAHVRLTIMGLDPVSYQTVVTTREFRASDGTLLFDHEYEDFATTGPNGERQLDLDNLNKTRPLAVPAAAAADDDDESKKDKGKAGEGGCEKEENDASLCDEVEADGCAPRRRRPPGSDNKRRARMPPFH